MCQTVPVLMDSLEIHLPAAQYYHVRVVLLTLLKLIVSCINCNMLQILMQFFSLFFQQKFHLHHQRQEIHATRHHVDQTLFARLKTIMPHANVSASTVEIHTKVADLNV